nr:MAG TPA: hypothetical protein [Caudoviricetes sp.]
MYTNIVKNQYIGKSKLNFYSDDNPLPNTMQWQELGFKLEDRKGIKFNSINKYLPDYYVPLYIKDIPKVNILPNDKVFYNKILLITGIPKGKSLEPFKLKNIIWESYYEDMYRGYLYQIISLESDKVKLKLKLNKSEDENNYQIRLC